jgi:hypothetical protein
MKRAWIQDFFDSGSLNNETLGFYMLWEPLNNRGYHAGSESR